MVFPFQIHLCNCFCSCCSYKGHYLCILILKQAASSYTFLWFTFYCLCCPLDGRIVLHLLSMLQVSRATEWPSACSCTAQEALIHGVSVHVKSFVSMRCVISQSIQLSRSSAAVGGAQIWSVSAKRFFFFFKETLRALFCGMAWCLQLLTPSLRNDLELRSDEKCPLLALANTHIHTSARG